MKIKDEPVRALMVAADIVILDVFVVEIKAEVVAMVSRMMASCGRKSDQVFSGRRIPKVGEEEGKMKKTLCWSEVGARCGTVRLCHVSQLF